MGRLGWRLRWRLRGSETRGTRVRGSETWGTRARGLGGSLGGGREGRDALARTRRSLLHHRLCKCERERGEREKISIH